MLSTTSRLLVIGAVVIGAAVLWAAGRQSSAPGAVAGSEIRTGELPHEARQTLALIKRGGPFPFRRDGVVFQNREQRLPVRARGYYTEYTVPTPGARDRGARRIIAGQGETGSPATSGEYFYTDDHYETFRRIRE